jgi:hypothetical protein
LYLHTSSNTASGETSHAQECRSAGEEDERNKNRGRLPRVLLHPFSDCLCDVDDGDLAQSFDGFVECGTGFVTEGMDGVCEVDACGGDFPSDRVAYIVSDGFWDASAC